MSVPANKANSNATLKKANGHTSHISNGGKATLFTQRSKMVDTSPLRNGSAHTSGQATPISISENQMMNHFFLYPALQNSTLDGAKKALDEDKLSDLIRKYGSQNPVNAQKILATESLLSRLRPKDLIQMLANLGKNIDTVWKNLPNTCKAKAFIKKAVFHTTEIANIFYSSHVAKSYFNSLQNETWCLEAIAWHQPQPFSGYHLAPLLAMQLDQNLNAKDPILFRWLWDLLNEYFEYRLEEVKVEIYENTYNALSPSDPKNSAEVAITTKNTLRITAAGPVATHALQTQFNDFKQKAEADTQSKLATKKHPAAKISNNMWLEIIKPWDTYWLKDSKIAADKKSVDHNRKMAQLKTYSDKIYNQEFVDPNEFYHFAMKKLWPLVSVNTPEARTILKLDAIILKAKAIAKHGNVNPRLYKMLSITHS